MTWSLSTINIKDGASSTKGIIQATDGTNFAPACAILDSSGAIMNPASAGLQTTGNTSLATIATNTPALGQTLKASSSPVTQSGGVLVAGGVLTRQANTTAYADGQHVSSASPAALAAAVAPANGVPVSLVRCRLQSSHVSSIANGVFKIFIFEVAPTSIAADAATFTCTGANCAGYFDVTLDQIFTDISLGIGYPHLGAAINATPAGGSQNIYYLIAAHAAYTPASAETLQVFFEVL